MQEEGGPVNEVHESRLSDIVKGTAKPSTRDSKTQTSESSLSGATVTLKESTVLTNGPDAMADSQSNASPVLTQLTVLTPPASPIT